MAKNIEIKAFLDNPELGLQTAKSLSGSTPEIIMQEDAFFNCEHGRLKLRKFSDEHGELIFYKRNDITGPKTCEYFITATQEPKKLHQVLAASYGVYGEVKKMRRLFLVGRTRIHIDRVEHLGDFLEFEVVLSDHDDIENAKTEANTLMKEFGIDQDRLIDCAYIDLIRQKAQSRST